MTILSLLQGDNIEPKSVTAHEMASSCPTCKGKDRFRIWPEKGRWWCRGCDRSGDEIEYLRVFRGLSFADSCSFLGREMPEKDSARIARKIEIRALRKPWEPKPDKTPCDTWQEKALAFIAWSHEQLLKNTSILQWLDQERGISLETLKARRLGWNEKDYFLARETWGLEPEKKPDGNFKKLWIPAGLVIPTFRGETLLRIRIRRHGPKEGEERYIFVSGGSSGAMILGEDQNNMVVVESELDAILLSQEAGDFCGAVALGNAQTRPDSYTFSILLSAETALVALDSDEAGAKEAWCWWKENVPNSERWAVIDGKDPTEAKKNGLPLREWILAGIPEKKEPASPQSAAELPADKKIESPIVQPASPNENKVLTEPEPTRAALTEKQVSAELRALQTTGKIPSFFTKAVTCKNCGPVFEREWVDDNPETCGWCHRKSGVEIPRPKKWTGAKA